MKTKVDRRAPRRVMRFDKARHYIANRLVKLARRIYPRSEEVTAFYADRLVELSITGHSIVKISTEGFFLPAMVGGEPSRKERPMNEKLPQSVRDILNMGGSEQSLKDALWDHCRHLAGWSDGKQFEPWQTRTVLATDPFCPRCGHNRDTSSVSSIDNEDGTKSCQKCGVLWREL